MSHDFVSGTSVAAKGIADADADGGGGSDCHGGTLDPCSVSFADVYGACCGLPGEIRTGGR